MEIGPRTRALVTGASRGIGRALAEALAARGARVALLARTAADLESVAASLPGSGHAAIAGDVGDRDDAARCVAGAIEALGHLDLVVSNAGVAHYKPFRLQPLEEIEQMTRVNWLGTAYIVHAALPHLLGRAAGHVVIVSSGSALRSMPSGAAYAGTKAAQQAFGEALRHELSGTGVDVTVVFPGQIATGLHDHERAAMPDFYLPEEEAESAGDLAAAIVRGVEAGARGVYYPANVRLLRAVNGVSPQAADRLLRVLRGPSIAPRAD
jgi:short-subunit dehydrogenase